MAVKQIFKRVKRVSVPVSKVVEKPVVEQASFVSVGTTKNNKEKKDKDMTLNEIERAEKIVKNMKDAPKVKIVKKERGLIERTESEKVVLTEDNRQVLND